MAKMLANREGVELSRNGTLTNPLLSPTIHGGDSVARVKPGDVAVLTLVIDTAGMVRPDYTLPGVAGFAFSLDGVTYGADGADLIVGDVDDAGVQVWAKAMSAQPGPVMLDLTSGQDSIVSLASDTPAGTDAGASVNSGTAPNSISSVASGADAGSSAEGGTAPTAVVVGDAPTGADAGAGVDAGASPSVPALVKTVNGLIKADDFNRADSATVGNGWTEQETRTGFAGGLLSWSILGNKLKAMANGFTSAGFLSPGDLQDDTYWTYRYGGFSGDANPTIALRQSGTLLAPTASTGIMSQAWLALNKLYADANGTSYGNPAYTHVAGDLHQVYAIGSNHGYYVNGVAKIANASQVAPTTGAIDAIGTVATANSWWLIDDIVIAKHYNLTVAGLSGTQAFRLFAADGTTVLGSSAAQSGGSAVLDLRACNLGGEPGCIIKVYDSTAWGTVARTYTSTAIGDICGGCTFTVV